MLGCGDDDTSSMDSGPVTADSGPAVDVGPMTDAGPTIDVGEMPAPSYSAACTTWIAEDEACGGVDSTAFYCGALGLVVPGSTCAASVDAMIACFVSAYDALPSCATVNSVFDTCDADFTAAETCLDTYCECDANGDNCSTTTTGCAAYEEDG